MKESPQCIYCEEIMTYGPRTQVVATRDKSVTYILYCWSCPMEDDNCDVVFDKKDPDKNKLNMDEARNELRKH